MFNKVTFNFLSYFLSGFLVLISISTNLSAAPRKPVYSSSNSSNESSVSALEQSSDSVENRLARLERLLESQSLVDLLMRLDNIQTELQNMRGDIEVVNHSINDIKRKQRDLYIDIDRRLEGIEKPSTATGNRSGNSSGQSTGAALTATTVAVTASSSKAEQKHYQQAFNLLRGLQYEKSIKAFNKFIAAYPKGRYAHIAQYWVGEANYTQGNFEQAIKAYQSLIKNYSKSPKVADALLKIGFSYYELNNIKKSKSNLNKLVKLYPDTTEASQAKNKLQKIKLNKSKR